MFNQNNLDKIKKIVKEFFAKTTFDVEIETKKSSEGTVSIDLKMDEPQILIGQGGETLAEIQHLLKMILYRKLGEQIFIDLDINDYKKKKIEYLKELAKNLAEEVALTKKEKILFPMPAYERRIIHMELSGNPNVTTESIGEEPERKVVVKPKS
jgi:spoIIIJ-associated protein